MYYGDAGIACSQENRNGVWDASYREVFHLNESGDQTDSTANAFTAAGKGAVTHGVTGQVGPAVDLAGGACGTTPAWLIVSDGKLTTTDSFTFEAWVYFRSYVPGRLHRLRHQGAGVPELRRLADAPARLLHGGAVRGLDRRSTSANGPTRSRSVGPGVAGPGGARSATWTTPVPSSTPAPGITSRAPSTWRRSTRRLFVNGAQVVTDTRRRLPRRRIPHYTRLGTDTCRTTTSTAARRDAGLLHGSLRRLDPDRLQQPERPVRGCGRLLLLGRPPAGIRGPWAPPPARRRTPAPAAPAPATCGRSATPRPTRPAAAPAPPPTAPRW